MSQENVEIARQGYEALNRDGVDGALRFLDREIEFVPIPDALPDAEHFHGHDGVRAWFEKIAEVFVILGWEPREYIDAGDRLVVEVTIKGRFKATDIPGDLVYYQAWTIRNGRAVHLESYLDRSQALAAVGLSE
jgi:ketosteroid isomerase-like protein